MEGQGRIGTITDNLRDKAILLRLKRKIATTTKTINTCIYSISLVGLQGFIES